MAFDLFSHRHDVADVTIEDALSMINRAEESLRIRQRAGALGAQGLPAATAEGLSDVELDIQGFHTDVVDGATGTALRRMTELVDRETRLGLSPDERSFVPLVRGLSAELHASQSQRREAARPMVEEHLAGKRQFDLFCSDHQLGQRPRVGPWWALAMVAMLGPVVEAAPSLGMFAEADKLGLYGAVSTVLLLGWANFACGAMAATGAMYCKSTSPASRYAGAAGLCIALFLGIGLNLLAAHLRLAAMTNPVGAYELARKTVMSNPLAPLYDWKSVGLLALSLAFIVGAWFKTRDTLGPCPGYRKHLVRLEKARKELQRARADALVVVGLRGEETLEAIEAQGEAVSAKAQAGRDLVGEAMGVVHGHQNAMTAARTSHQRCFATFRGANQSVRGGVPAPAYFRTLPALETPMLSLPEGFALKAEALRHEAEQVLATKPTAVDDACGVIAVTQSEIEAWGDDGAGGIAGSPIQPINVIEEA